MEKVDRAAYVFDPTVADDKSRARGVGRYLQTMQQYLQPDFAFTHELTSVPKHSVFINPFFNHLRKPLKFGRIAQKQIAIIHDVIPLKYPHQFPIGIKGRVWKLINNFWTLNQYDLVVTDSNASKKTIVKYTKIPEEKIRVVYATVPRMFLPHLDTAEETPAHHHPFHKEGDKTIPEYSNIPIQEFLQKNVQNINNDFVLYVGDATWNKNLVNMAKAIQMANVPCVCVGKVFADQTKVKSGRSHPWLASLNRFFKQVQNDDRFIFPGYVSNLDLLALYKKAKINVLVSHDEGFGLSFIEAGYMSTPSVLSNVPIFQETAQQSAYFANPNDPKDMAQKISQLFHDRMLHEKLSVAAFSRAQDFGPTAFRQNWMETVAQLAE